MALAGCEQQGKIPGPWQNLLLLITTVDVIKTLSTLKQMIICINLNPGHTTTKTNQLKTKVYDNLI